VIRELRVEELSQLAPLAASFYAASEFLVDFNLEYFVELWTRVLTQEMGVILVEENANGIQGTLGGFIHRDLYGERTIVEELFWYVLPGARGGGVRLYRAFERWARAHGAHEIQMVHLLDSMPEKVGGFYLRDGFKPVETRYKKALV
jgi:GNAT superfamily N-acetyltransferase